MNVFRMPFLCADSGTWRKMSRARPGMSAITTLSGSTRSNHQESACGAAKARQERVIVEVVKKALLVGDFLLFVGHICKCFLSVLS